MRKYIYFFKFLEDRILDSNGDVKAFIKSKVLKSKEDYVSIYEIKYNYPNCKMTRKLNYIDHQQQLMN